MREEEGLPDESVEERDFRVEVRKWLAGAGLAPAEVGGLVSPWADHAEAAVADSRAFQRSLYEAGYAGLSWPVVYGGGGRTPRHEYIFDQEAGRYELPTGVFSIGLGMCGPTLLAHGTEDQKLRYIAPMLRGEEIWAQIFSEPAAGSDLAALRTRAVRDGGTWSLTGQKVWTSGALISRFGLVLARSDPKRPRHAGLTMFIVDLAAPGVTIRPLRQMTGHAKFAEIFFDDVRIADDQRVGAENDGWRCAITTLMNERFSVGGLKYAQRGGSAQLIIERARRLGLGGDPVVRQRLARLWSAETIFGYLHHKVGSAVMAGREPGPEGSILKLAMGAFIGLAAGTGADLVGARAGAWEPDEPLADGWSERLCGAPCFTIAGGTTEVLKNLVAERVLGLPRDTADARDVPFDEWIRRFDQRGSL
ncbi:MAG TPA: acyl-CoA dehydrogenase family protein [Acidimicrobiia bacterium]|nr:acyl-CoA dehydrogenase family protein [Acidimicrobiia bacterium]